MVRLTSLFLCVCVSLCSRWCHCRLFSLYLMQTDRIALTSLSSSVILDESGPTVQPASHTGGSALKWQLLGWDIISHIPTMMQTLDITAKVLEWQTHNQNTQLPTKGHRLSECSYPPTWWELIDVEEILPHVETFLGWSRCRLSERTVGSWLHTELWLHSADCIDEID